MHPTTLYHKSDPPRVVTDPADLQRLLEEGWADTPAAFYPKSHPGALKPSKKPEDGGKS